MATAGSQPKVVQALHNHDGQKPTYTFYFDPILLSSSPLPPLHFSSTNADISSAALLSGMSSHYPVHITARPSFYHPGAVCLQITRDALHHLSTADPAAPDASLLLDALRATWPRPRTAMIDFPLQKMHDFLPLPALSSSRPHLCCPNLALVVPEELRHLSALTFRSGRAGIAGISDYRAFWLVSYFILNLVLTLYNKVLLVSFPYPYTLTATHALFGLVGGTCLRLRAVYRPKSLWGSDYILLVAFSFLYSINIAISNASLDLVTVPVGRLHPL